MAGRHGRTVAVVGVALAAVLVAGACSGSGSGSRPGSGEGGGASPMSAGPKCVTPVAENGTKGKGCLKLAPSSDRVDLASPVFSHPTSVTNPIHPTGRITQTLYGGRVEGKPFRTEVTLLPDVKTIAWAGHKIRALTSQYVAYLDGRINEVALDWYAQADDGAVWYLGEDVFNYENGSVADTEGTWVAGKDGPPAMIMPAHPRPGDVYRSENAPGVVFEEVRVKAVGRTVPGPGGPVKGAITVTETHADGTTEDKVFAPGYGEFDTREPNGGDVEAMALAVPTDALPGPVPDRLGALCADAGKAFDAAGRKDWTGVADARASLRRNWKAYRSGGVPGRLGDQLDTAADALDTAVESHDAAKARQAALDAGQAGLGFQLRYRPPAEIDRARLDLWARQLLVDTAAGDPGAVSGDVTTVGWILDRVRHGSAPAAVSRVDDRLRELRGAVGEKDLTAVAGAVPDLRKAVRALGR